MNLSSDWNFESLAKTAGFSKTRFHDLCVKYYGEAPCERLCKLRMERAKILLFEESENLDLIAAKVGYGSAYAFSKAFLKVYGVRPGKFRKNL